MSIWSWNTNGNADIWECYDNHNNATLRLACCWGTFFFIIILETFKKWRGSVRSSRCDALLKTYTTTFINRIKNINLWGSLKAININLFSQLKKKKKISHISTYYYIQSFRSTLYSSVFIIAALPWQLKTKLKSESLRIYKHIKLFFRPTTNKKGIRPFFFVQQKVMETTSESFRRLFSSSQHEEEIPSISGASSRSQDPGSHTFTFLFEFHIQSATLLRDVFLSLVTPGASFIVQKQITRLWV